MISLSYLTLVSTMCFLFSLFSAVRRGNLIFEDGYLQQAKGIKGAALLLSAVQYRFHSTCQEHPRHVHMMNDCLLLLRVCARRDSAPAHTAFNRHDLMTSAHLNSKLDALKLTLLVIYNKRPLHTPASHGIPILFVTPITPFTCSHLDHILRTNLGSNLHGVWVAVHATQLDTTFIADKSLLKLGNKLHAAVGVVEQLETPLDIQDLNLSCLALLCQ